MLNCDLPHTHNDKILLSHGDGGRLSHQLVEKIIKPHFQNPCSDIPVFTPNSHDGAVLPWTAQKDLVFSTDSYIIKPLYFAGGSIAELAVFGTVNDLAMCGARARFLSCSFIIEEGFPIGTLEDLARRMGRAARICEVQIVTGDTKVVEHGSGDGIFINTSGIGQRLCQHPINGGSIEDGDAILISGDLGRHSLAVMARRHKIELPDSITSDIAPLHSIVEKLLHSSINLNIRCLRDLTRGGLASALYELQNQCKLGFKLDLPSLPVQDEVQSLCDLLGLNPLHLANEGCFILFLPSTQSESALKILKNHGHSYAAIIGHVHRENSKVTYLNEFGVERVVDWPLGSPLPRIC